MPVIKLAVSLIITIATKGKSHVMLKCKKPKPLQDVEMEDEANRNMTTKYIEIEEKNEQMEAKI
jgi:hypothetical protein